MGSDTKIHIPKWIKVLHLIKLDSGKPIIEYAKKFNRTYNNDYNMIKEMEGRDWVKVEKIGKYRIVNITRKGKNIINILEKEIPEIMVPKDYVIKTQTR